jgi:hypothetical protein
LLRGELFLALFFDVKVVSESTILFSCPQLSPTFGGMCSCRSLGVACVFAAIVIFLTIVFCASKNHDTFADWPMPRWYLIL